MEIVENKSLCADLLLILNFVYFEFVENVKRCTHDILNASKFSAWHRLVSHIGAKQIYPKN